MIKDIISSIKNYFKAFSLINKIGLWKYFLIPALIGLLLGVFFISTAYGLSDDLGEYISKLWPFEYGKNTIGNLSSWLGGLIILLLGIIVYKHALMALSAPFMTPVSEKVEAFITSKEPRKKKGNTEFFKLLFRSIRLNIRNLLKELLITIPLIFLSLIPVIGIFASVLILYIQSYYTGFGNIDYTLERYFNYRDSKSFVKRHRGIAVGNGLIFTLMLFIPLIGVMLTLPIATVAATIDTTDKLLLEEQLIINK
jgi:CysZ protein